MSYTDCRVYMQGVRWRRKASWESEVGDVVFGAPFFSAPSARDDLTRTAADCVAPPPADVKGRRPRPRPELARAPGWRIARLPAAPCSAAGAEIVPPAHTHIRAEFG
ncbi:hypothetical protein HPB50_000906 [Hyalomma asiaticum]|uniref:Uncharacterized protein n=1 Tax=Hyalomma asiaticum TaxID=266040 RepID=A0ACB7SCP8_HYAAI|nr:hypothetical protein HPB50_000906 [Hyalomma asiaticum]